MKNDSISPVKFLFTTSCLIVALSTSSFAMPPKRKGGNQLEKKANQEAKKLEQQNLRNVTATDNGGENSNEFTGATSAVTPDSNSSTISSPTPNVTTRKTPGKKKITEPEHNASGISPQNIRNFIAQKQQPDANSTVATQNTSKESSSSSVAEKLPQPQNQIQTALKERLANKQPTPTDSNELLLSAFSVEQNNHDGSGTASPTAAALVAVVADFKKSAEDVIEQRKKTPSPTILSRPNSDVLEKLEKISSFSDLTEADKTKADNLAVVPPAANDIQKKLPDLQQSDDLSQTIKLSEEKPADERSEKTETLTRESFLKDINDGIAELGRIKSPYSVENEEKNNRYNTLIKMALEFANRLKEKYSQLPDSSLDQEKIRIIDVKKMLESGSSLGVSESGEEIIIPSKEMTRLQADCEFYENITHLISQGLEALKGENIETAIQQSDELCQRVAALLLNYRHNKNNLAEVYKEYLQELKLKDDQNEIDFSKREEDQDLNPPSMVQSSFNINQNAQAAIEESRAVINRVQEMKNNANSNSDGNVLQENNHDAMVAAFHNADHLVSTIPTRSTACLSNKAAIAFASVSFLAAGAYYAWYLQSQQAANSQN